MITEVELSSYSRSLKKRAYYRSYLFQGRAEADRCFDYYLDYAKQKVAQEGGVVERRGNLVVVREGPAHCPTRKWYIHLFENVGVFSDHLWPDYHRSQPTHSPATAG